MVEELLSELNLKVVLEVKSIVLQGLLPQKVGLAVALNSLVGRSEEGSVLEFTESGDELRAL